MALNPPGAHNLFFFRLPAVIGKSSMRWMIESDNTIRFAAKTKDT